MIRFSSFRCIVILGAMICFAGIPVMGVAAGDLGELHSLRSTVGDSLQSNLPAKDGSRAVLYDNGPLVTAPGGGAGGADISELQTALGMNTLGGGCQYSYGNHMADDFTVSMPWNIETIMLFAYQTNSTTTSPLTQVFVQILDGPPDSGGSVIWGDLTTNRMISTDWTGIYRVTDTTQTATTRPVMYAICDVPVTLGPGTYWLDFSYDGDAGLSGPWQPPITILGQTTTGNAKQYTGSWADFLDSGTATGQGLPFVINGQISGGTLIDFDDLPSTSVIGSHYSGVTFSPGWMTWDSTGSPYYPPHSSPNVAFTHETTNFVEWDSPILNLSLYLSTVVSTSETWTFSVYNDDGALLN
nr:hypothetical protein [bacterium]